MGDLRDVYNDFAGIFILTVTIAAFSAKVCNKHTPAYLRRILYDLAHEHLSTTYTT